MTLDQFRIGADIFFGLMSIALTIGLFYVAAKASKIDKLEERIGVMAEKIVDNRFATLSGEMRLMVGELSTLVEQMQVRLNRGDDHFEKADDKRQTLELQLKEAVHLVREWAAREFASKEELREIARQLNTVDRQLASFQARLDGVAA